MGGHRRRRVESRNTRRQLGAGGSSTGAVGDGRRLRRVIRARRCRSHLLHRRRTPRLRWQLPGQGGHRRHCIIRGSRANLIGRGITKRSLRHRTRTPSSSKRPRRRRGHGRRRRGRGHILSLEGALRLDGADRNRAGGMRAQRGRGRGCRQGGIGGAVGQEGLRSRNGSRQGGIGIMMLILVCQLRHFSISSAKGRLILTDRIGRGPGPAMEHACSWARRVRGVKRSRVPMCNDCGESKVVVVERDNGCSMPNVRTSPLVGGMEMMLGWDEWADAASEQSRTRDDGTAVREHQQRMWRK